VVASPLEGTPGFPTNLIMLGERMSELELRSLLLNTTYLVVNNTHFGEESAMRAVLQLLSCFVDEEEHAARLLFKDLHSYDIERVADSYASELGKALDQTVARLLRERFEDDSYDEEKVRETRRVWQKRVKFIVKGANVAASILK